MGLQIEKLEAAEEITAAENATATPQTDTSQHGEVATQLTGGAEAKPAEKPEPKPEATKPEGQKANAKAEQKTPDGDEVARSWAKLRTEQQAFWREQKQFKDEQAKAQSIPEFKSAEDLAKFLENNPHGITFETLLDHYTPGDDNGEKTDPLRQDVEALKRERDEAKAKAEKAEQQKVWDDGVAAVGEAVKSINAAEDNALQLLDATGAHAQVLVKMQEHQREFGQPLDWREAADQVESELRAQWEPVIDTLVALPMFASRYAKVQSDDPKSQTKKTNGASATARETLTNDVGAEAGGGADALPLDPDARDAAIRKRMGWA